MSKITLEEQAAASTPSANQVVIYPKSDGLLYSKDDVGTETALGGLLAATQAQMESASSTTVAVTPGVTIYNPGVAKCWAFFLVGSGVTASFGYSSITANATGDYTYNWSRTFSSTNYAVVATAGVQGRQTNVSARTTTSSRVLTSNTVFILEDNNTSVVCFGDI